MGVRPSVGPPGRYCVLSDLHATPDTRLDLAYLERRLRHYPHQSLAANILEGVRLDADVELGPYGYLTSPHSPSGYASVGKELRRPRSIWWYEFYSSLPFSGSCTSTARGRRRSRRGRTGTFGASARLGGTSSTPASPFRLVYLNGQGATAHKLGPDRLRRPTEGNGPRPPTFDTSGLQAISSSPRRADLCFEDNAKDYFDQLVMAPSELHKTRRRRRRG